MKRSLSILIFAVVAFGCGGTKGVPADFANACNVDNDAKVLEIGGVLQIRTSIFCSNRGGRMECPFDFVEAAGSEKKITADIEQGSGANKVDEITRGFKKEDIKVRDDAGNPVGLGGDKVKLTG